MRARSVNRDGPPLRAGVKMFQWNIMRSRAPTLGLGHRFALANLAVGAALAAGLIFVQTRAAKDAIRQRAALGAQVALEQTAALCRSKLAAAKPRVAAAKPRQLFDALQPLMTLDRFVYIDVFDASGRPVVQLTNPERHRGLTQDAPGRRPQEDDVLDVSQPLAAGGRALGRLEIGLWVRGIQDDLRAIERRGWLAGLLLCSMLVVVSWALGAGLSTRLRRLTEDIRRRGVDDFSPLEARGADEVAQLAGAFNRRQNRLHEERERREAAEAARQDMVHMIVHDMKGPLSVFRSGMPFLRERAVHGGDARVGRMMDMLTEGSGRLLRMAEGILNVARVEDAQVPIDRKPVDLAALARARAEAAGLSAKEKGVAVSVDVAAHLPECFGDADLLARVVDNLLLNAVEHTPKGGKIHLSLGRRGTVLRLEVQDGGPGVAADERRRIFEKFRKGRSLSQGAGLGLAFCRLAVERHGGDIGVQDAPHGTGALFYVHLPLKG